MIRLHSDFIGVVPAAPGSPLRVGAGGVTSLDAYRMVRAAGTVNAGRWSEVVPEAPAPEVVKPAEPVVVEAPAEEKPKPRRRGRPRKPKVEAVEPKPEE